MKKENNTILEYYFEITVFLLTCIVFLVASYQDLKERLVDGIIWLVLIVLLLPVTLIRLLLFWDKPGIILFMIISVIMGLVLTFVMLLFGLWGGADIIALFCLSIISPISIQLIGGLPSIHNNNFLSLILPISLSLVMNAALVQIPIPLFILGKNFINVKKHPNYYLLPKTSTKEKIFASCLGEPLPLRSILTKPIFYYQVLEKNPLFTNKVELNEVYPVPFIRLTSEPLIRWKLFRTRVYSILNPSILVSERDNAQFKLQNGYKKNWNFDFTVSLKSEEEDLFRQRTLLEHAVTELKTKKNILWVQYSVPFIVPMLIGYILAFNGINILIEIAKFFKIF